MTIPVTIFIVIVITAAIAVPLIVIRTRHLRRAKLFRKPLAQDWTRILQDNVPIYARLPETLKPTLHGSINLFLDDKEFIGCAGFEITDRVRLTIAGNACVLLLKQDDHEFHGFSSILVYPDTYVAEETTYDGLVESTHQSVRAGESWHRGPVILSWSDIEEDRLPEYKGHNVILHEFAHKLDEENTLMDGLPILRHPEDYQAWANVLRKEFQELRERVNKHKHTVLDEYASVSPPEFFAVATETFFEKSTEMKDKLPELYEQLSKYYDLDPANWH